jgi:hypothetical protein
MKGPIRFLAALLALVAFSAYLAQNAVASMCLPGTSGGHSAAEAVHADGHGAAHHGHGGASDGSEGSQDSQPGSPICPMGMAGSGGSCVSASLPLAASTQRPLDVADAPPVLFLDHTHDRLLVTAQFRPPRA